MQVARQVVSRIKSENRDDNNMERPLFGGDGSGGSGFGFQFQQRLFVVARHDLDEARQGGFPIIQKCPRPVTACEEKMPLDQDPQPFGVEAQRIAHATVVNAGRPLPRPAGLLGQAEFGDTDFFELHARHVA